MTVHMLKTGLAVCGAGMPNDWPDGDRWVAYNNKSDRGSINCQGCLASDEIPLYREELALEMADAVLKLTQAQGDIGEIKGSAVPPMYRVRMDKFPSGDPNPYWAEDVRKRDEVLFALRDVMRWADPHAVPGCDKNVETHEKAKELLTAHCPGCRGRYTETDKHTCVREGT